MSERVQKYLSRVGRGSRREAERWIGDGRVTIDGRKAVLGDKVDSTSLVAVDGIPVVDDAGHSEVVIYNKPVGKIVTRSDPNNRPTVFDDLPINKHGRWVAVGRLDINTAGVMLFCSDGNLANGLMHPRNEIEREYLCRVNGIVSESDLASLCNGIQVDGHMCRFDSVEARPGGGNNRWFTVVLRQGRYREVRRLWQAVGGTVSRLIRVRFGPVRLPRDLDRGRTRFIDYELQEKLYRLANVSPS